MSRVTRNEAEKRAYLDLYERITVQASAQELVALGRQALLARVHRNDLLAACTRRGLNQHQIRLVMASYALL